MRREKPQPPGEGTALDVVTNREREPYEDVLDDILCVVSGAEQGKREAQELARIAPVEFVKSAASIVCDENDEFRVAPLTQR
jgi:hypothetical protein